MLKFLREQLQKLLEQRKTLAAERDAFVADIEKRGAITEAEQKTFDEKRAAIAKLDDDREALEARIKTAEDDEKRELAAAAAYKEVGQTGPERREGGAKVTNEPHVYGKHSRSSYFLDLVRNDLNRGDGDGGVQAARQRLQRHAQELAVDLPAREARRDQAADRQIRGLEGVTDQARENAFEKRVNPNRTDGQGGFCEMAAAAA